MTDQPMIRLHDGNQIPQLGLGVWQATDDEAAQAVEVALTSGYRHVDTAAIYRNETGVGRGIAAAGLPRADLFLTTKVWNEDQGFDSTLRAFEASLQRLGTEYVDLYLIHWPAPQRGAYVETWKALMRLKEEGRAKSIGVSNFCPEHLERLQAETGMLPVLNQVELHPAFQQRSLKAVHGRMGIATEAWSPLGQGRLLEDPVVTAIAGAQGRSPAQVLIRWHLQSGHVVIPKSVTPERIRANAQVLGFALSGDEMAALDGLDRADGRIGPDPMTAAF